MEKRLNIEMKSTLKLTVFFAILLSFGIIVNSLVDADQYSFHVFMSCALKVVPILLTCLIVDDLYRLKTKKYRKDKLLIESFLLVLMILCSISYDFNLTSTILFLIIISYNFLLITSEFIKKK